MLQYDCLMADETTSNPVVEEQYAGEGTGVEQEIDEFEADGGLKPWDPEKIRVSTKSFSLRNVVDMIANDDLDLAPDFQRNKVWKPRQKSRLIESLLLQIPLPAFYFAEDTDGMLRVVDGLQRLSTIYSYARDESFTLRDLEYLGGESDKHFSELSTALQRRLLNAQIVVHVIDPSTPPDVKYDIFKRINTGGDPLNSMEIRHSMSKPRSREFLKKCISSPDFDEATGGRLRDHVRMQDREAVLRFMAFRLLDSIPDYENHGSLESLLTWANTQLDNPEAVSDRQLESLFHSFEKAMKNALVVFGPHSFRKWPNDTDRLMPINRAMFESWAAVLSEYDQVPLEGARAEIVALARQAMTDNTDYISSISSSTSDPKRVQKRFEVPRKIVSGLLR